MNIYEKAQANAKQLPLKLKVSLKAVSKVFIRPWYLLGAFVGSFIASSLVVWATNLDLVRHIIFELNVAFSVKLSLFWSNYIDLYSRYNENFDREFIHIESAQEFGTILFSILFGLNIALLVYVLKNQGFKNLPKKSSFGGTVFAVLAGGCVACGTSILAPLAATVFGVTSGAFLRDLAVWLNWGASVLIAYSIYKLGLLAATAQAKKMQKAQTAKDQADRD